MTAPATIAFQLQPSDVRFTARVAFESVSALRAAFGEPRRPHWEFQSSATQHDTEVIVRRIGVGTITSPEAIHQQWRDEMHRNGWRRDEAASWTLEICDWGELSPEAQARYRVLFAVTVACFQSQYAIVAARLRGRR